MQWSLGFQRPEVCRSPLVSIGWTIWRLRLTVTFPPQKKSHYIMQWGDTNRKQVLIRQSEDSEAVKFSE